MRTLITIAQLLIASAALAQPPDPATLQNVVVTSGEAVVRQTPDRAFVTVSVEARARSPRDAQRQNAEAMTAVQQRLDQARVPKDAMRTLGYDLQQEYDFPQGRRVPREIVARNAVEVRVDDGPWMKARLHRRSSRNRKGFAWRFWTAHWPSPTAGEHRVTSRGAIEQRVSDQRDRLDRGMSGERFLTPFAERVDARVGPDVRPVTSESAQLDIVSVRFFADPEDTNEFMLRPVE